LQIPQLRVRFRLWLGLNKQLSTLVLTFNFIFSTSNDFGADGMLIPELHKALFVCIIVTNIPKTNSIIRKNNVDKRRTAKIIDQFDEEELKRQGIFGISHHGRGSDESFIRANKEGLELFALELLKSARDTEAILSDTEKILFHLIIMKIGLMKIVILLFNLFNQLLTNKNKTKNRPQNYTCRQTNAIWLWTCRNSFSSFYYSWTHNTFQMAVLTNHNVQNKEDAYCRSVPEESLLKAKCAKQDTAVCCNYIHLR